MREGYCRAAGRCGAGAAAKETFPGELYTEIGQSIKAHSPFRRTGSFGFPVISVLETTICCSRFPVTHDGLWPPTRSSREIPETRRTFIIGLANGYVGYLPTRKAIDEGGYAEDTRRVGRAAEQVVVEHSLALLRGVQRMPISD